MAKKESKKEGGGIIAAYVAKYSNKGTGAGYKNSIEAFLRCIFQMSKEQAKGRYESLLDQYLSEKGRDQSGDIKRFAACLVQDSVSAQSARQRLTYAAKFLRDKGITVTEEDIQDIKRETKGGAATVDKVMTHKVICQAVTGGDIRDKALFLMLASSGARLNEMLSLTMSDIDMQMTPVMVNFRHTKNGNPRYSFISSEAAEALRQYLAVRDDYIEGGKKRIENLKKAGKKAEIDEGTELLFPVQDSSVNKSWETLLRKAGLYSRDAKSQRNQYRIHSLRKFFISQMSLAGAKTLGEHLAGHEGYLDASYRQVSPEYAAAEYLKVEKFLICCIPESAKKAIEIANDKIAVLQTKTAEQSESIDDVRALNAALREQMKSQQEQISGITAELQRLNEMFSASIALAGKPGQSDKEYYEGLRKAGFEVQQERDGSLHVKKR